MNINPCCICGEMPIIEKISSHWWNATHDECLGEPGINIANAPSADHAIEKWNKWQKRIARREVAIIRVDMIAAEHNVHLTAFGVQPSESIPLQLPLFADDLSATNGGR
jgi:hypothetical protein